MRTITLLFAAIAVVGLVACAKPIPAEARAGQDTSVVQAFIDALNTTDKAKIQAFVDAKCTKEIGAKVDRITNFSKMGAPFKLAKIIDSSVMKIDAQLEDTNGVPISLTMSLAPDGKISSVMLRAGEAAPVHDYSAWSSLAALTDQIRTDTDSPAMAIAVLHDGKVENAVSGVREMGKPDVVTADEPFSIGSIGKPLCSTVIGILIDQGKLRWDETLEEALPGTPMKDDYKKVTLEEIMHHRGGIPEEMGMRKPQVDRLVNGETDPIKIRENYTRDILSRDPTGKPNERFSYSNGGYELLGHIAERTMNKPYETLVSELVFKPLGMTHSYTNMDTKPTERPSGHVQGEGGKWEPMNMSGKIEVLFAAAGGGMYCSASDLVKFGQMHMDGLNGKDGLLKAATVQRLHQGIPEELEAASPSDIHEPYTAGPNSRLYACGWGIEAHPGIEIMHTHNGSNGTMRAQLAIFPKAGVVVAAYVNCGGESEPSPPLQAAIAVGQKYAKN